MKLLNNDRSCIPLRIDQESRVIDTAVREASKKFRHSATAANNLTAIRGKVWPRKPITDAPVEGNEVPVRNIITLKMQICEMA